MNDKVLEYLQKLPWEVLAVVYLVWLGYGYYGFISNDDSPLVLRQNEIVSVRTQNQNSTKRLDTLYEFVRKLDEKKAEIRSLALELSELKTNLSDELDIPDLIRLVVNEANTVGLRVLSIKPLKRTSTEYYTEQAFEMEFQGVYAQLLVYLERLARHERIIRIDTFEIKNQSPSTSTFVQLRGKLEVKAFQYLGSKADEVNHEKLNSTGASVPARPAGGSP